MTAPIASGWSESPGGPRTHWKAPPFHGARRKRPLRKMRPSPLGSNAARPLKATLATDELDKARQPIPPVYVEVPETGSRTKKDAPFGGMLSAHRRPP